MIQIESVDGLIGGSFINKVEAKRAKKDFELRYPDKRFRVIRKKK